MVRRKQWDEETIFPVETLRSPFALGTATTCVAVCPTEARIFGQRREIVRETRRSLAVMEEGGANAGLEGDQDQQALAIFLLPQ